MDGGKDGVRCRDTIVDDLDGGDTKGWIYDEGGFGVHNKIATDMTLITSFSMTFFLAISLRYSRQYSSAVNRSSSSISSSPSTTLGTAKKQVMCEL